MNDVKKEYITKREIFERLVKIRGEFEDINCNPLESIIDLETSILQDIR